MIHSKLISILGLSSFASYVSLSISFQTVLASGRLSGSASQHRSASFLYSSGAESGICGRSPSIISRIKLASNCLSLKGGLPVAIKYIIIPKEYTSDFRVYLRVWKTSGAIKGISHRMLEFDSHEFTDRKEPRSQI